MRNLDPGRVVGVEVQLAVPVPRQEGLQVGGEAGELAEDLEAVLTWMLGERPVTTLAWESFGEGWVKDVVGQLKLSDAVRRLSYAVRTPSPAWPPSSSGPGPRPFTAVAPVRIRLGVRPHAGVAADWERHPAMV